MNVIAQPEGGGQIEQQTRYVIPYDLRAAGTTGLLNAHVRLLLELRVHVLCESSLGDGVVLVSRQFEEANSEPSLAQPAVIARQCR